MSEQPASADSEPRLSPNVEQYLSGFEGQARDLSLSLVTTWQNRDSHDKEIERRALWHALRLSQACEATQHQDLDYRWFISDAARGADPEVRYDIQAATRMIPKLLPFTYIDIARLLKHPAEDFETWEADVLSREPALANQWHRWLWANSSKELHSESDHGSASELALATSRLASGLETILGLWDAKI
jgi:hypothetical protein